MAAKDLILLGALIGAKTASRVGVRPMPHAHETLWGELRGIFVSAVAAPLIFWVLADFRM